jgi:hypothetical protein
MPKIITIYWRDIPAQVTAKEGRKRAKKLLPARFQEAIDRAAMRAKKTNADAYLDDWRRVNQNQSGELDALVEETATRLEQEYDDERLDKIVRNKGVDNGATD